MSLLAFIFWCLITISLQILPTLSTEDADVEACKPESKTTSEQSFIKLTPNPNFLHGARWELQKNKTQIVYNSLEIIDISSISDTNAEFRLDVHFRQRWSEPELVETKGLFAEDDTNSTSVIIGAEVLSDLWTPDPYIPNARHAVIENLVGPMSSVRIYKNKTIVYSATMHITLGCPMSFHWFPCDIQYCELVLESFSHPIQYLLYEWEVQNPVILPTNFRLRRYSVRRPLQLDNSAQTRFGRDDIYSRITVHFVFERQIGHHLIQVYMPTFLIVALSWFSFWLGMDAIPGRVSLIVTCMLTLVTMYSSIKSDLPPVAYIKMLDIWMAGCLAFVFAAMSEFITAKFLHQAIKKAENKKNVDILDKELLNPEAHAKKLDNIRNMMTQNPYSEFYRTTPNILNQLKNRGRPAWDIPVLDLGREFSVKGNDEREYLEALKMQEKMYLNFQHEQKQKRKLQRGERQLPRWEVMDNFSKWIFPLAFLIFCCIYWPLLMFGSTKWQTKQAS